MVADEIEPRRSRAPLTLRAVAWAASVVAVCVVLAVVFLVWPLPLIPLLTADDQLSALRTALTIGAGAAGAATLLLAGRRQVHQEEVAAATSEADARERRITELYVKSVDQLGAERAPVRLGGLHSLERLAQDNPAHRQAVVDVICSYLRMPFPVEDAALLAAVESDSGGPWIASFAGTTAEREELQVRMSAQVILTRHLRPNDRDTYATSVFWPGLSLNLTSAILVDFEFQSCRAAAVRFVGATFVGKTRFYQCEIEGSAEFDKARFFGAAWFWRADFASWSWFSATEFHGQVDFTETHFGKRATYGEAAWFGGSRFRAGVDFSGARFDTAPDLHGALVAVRTDLPTVGRAWPPGWQLAPAVDGEDWACVVQAPHV